MVTVDVDVVLAIISVATHVNVVDVAGPANTVAVTAVVARVGETTCITETLPPDTLHE